MRPLVLTLAGLVAVAASLAAPVAVSATSAPPSPTEPPAAGSVPDAGDDAILTAARDGLAAWLAANKPASPSTSTDLPGCPAVELGTLEAAMADAGLVGALGDWGTEIEWSEYQDVDPNLMGITCGGDTDGDANDGEYELAAGVVAIDAGTDERAIDVIAGVGFGALDVIDAEIPGVTGGDLTTGCISDDGLSTCVTLWSEDGLIVGVVLFSDEQGLPDDASEAVLTELLPAMLETLASQADAVPVAPGSDPPVIGDGTPVGDARAGLTRILGDSADTPIDAPLETCVLADVDRVDAAMETSGADTPLSGWGQWVGPIADDTEWPQRAIVCEGAYVGTGDASFPETSVALAAADFDDDETLGSYLAGHLGVAADEEPIAAPGAGGETIGRCAQKDRVYDCYELWTDGSGFAVMVHIQDQTYFDRQSASVVLDELVPSVLDALGSGATQVGDELEGADSGQVDGARAGLEAFVDEAGATSSLECPAATIDDVQAALDDAGVDEQIDGWFARFHELESDNGAEPALRLVCTDAESLVTLDVIDFGAVVDADEFVASVGLADGGTPDDLEPGAVVVGSCTSVSGEERCVALWRAGTFVIGVTLFADADGITRDDAGEMLTVLAPTVLSSLESIAR